MNSYRFLMYGFGTVGRSIANVLTRAKHDVIAIEPDAAIREEAIAAFDAHDLPDILPEARWKQAGQTDVAIHTATNDLDTTVLELTELLARGQPVVTTHNQFVYPYTHAEYAVLHELATRKRVPWLSTSMPSFAMAELPMNLVKGLDTRPYRVEINRTVDATQRAAEFRQGLGIGLSTREFAAKKSLLGRPGVLSAARIVAHELYPGLQFDPQEDIEPDSVDGTVVGIAHRISIHNIIGNIVLTYRAGNGYHDEDAYRFFTMEDKLLHETRTSGYHGDRTLAAQVANIALGVAQTRERGNHVCGYIPVGETPRAFPWYRHPTR